MQRVLLVCLGNICRSPMAEGVLRERLVQAGLSDAIEVDSAGTSSWHRNSPPDERAQAAAIQRGYDISMLRSRPIALEDFEIFDEILAMDRSNLANLIQFCPDHLQHKIKLFLSYSKQWNNRDVPDPFQSTQNAFDLVLNMVEDAIKGFIDTHRPSSHECKDLRS